MIQTAEANPTDSNVVREQWLPTQAAVRAVVRFERRFGEKHLKLACYAALPLILTPELLNLIRINFLSDQEIPWFAEADLLLSPLCRSIGEGLYEIEPAIREVLMVELEQTEGWRILLDIARFLQVYVSRQNSSIEPEVLKTLSWIARAYLYPDQVVQELAESLKQSNAQSDLFPKLQGQLQALLMVETLAEPLTYANDTAAYQGLLAECQHLARSLYGEGSDDDDRSDSDLDLGVELETFAFEMVEFVEPELPTFTFETVTVNAKGEAINRASNQAAYFTEPLGQGVSLEMVAIPAGSFQMGSPKNEPKRSPNESPQHPVTVPAFFMGKYAVTQAQWRFVAGLPQQQRELEPDPSRFKGDDLPVESVSWHEAVEFCDRLSQHTGRVYRLPTEAEWEYACRAGTTSRFHFGATITAALANYNGTYVYAQGPKGEYRNKTTPVGSFLPNAFGLYDLHGNVWEWCADHWHENYQGAPPDGSAWITGGNSDRRVLRGGSWYYFPALCRSAYRLYYVPDLAYLNGIGFRVVSSASRT